MIPGVDSIDAARPIKDIDIWAARIIENHHYFHAVTRSGSRIYNFPQGQGNPVFIGYFLIQSVTYPLSWFTKWEEDFLPDPLRIYKPI